MAQGVLEVVRIRYLVDAVRLPTWRTTLVAAAAQLAEHTNQWPDAQLQELSQNLHRIADSDLSTNTVPVRAVADHVAALLDQIQVPGIPQPQDPHWAF